MTTPTKAIITYGTILLLTQLVLDLYVEPTAVRMGLRIALTLPAGIATWDVLAIHARRLSRAAADRFLARGGATQLDAAALRQLGSIQDAASTDL